MVDFISASFLAHHLPTYRRIDLTLTHLDTLHLHDNLRPYNNTIDMEDDLTASHWDDVLSPSHTVLLASNHFRSLALDDPYRDPNVRHEDDVQQDDLGQEDESDNEDEQRNDSEVGNEHADSALDNSSQHALHSPLHSSYLPDFPAPQVSEYEQEERRQQRAAMVSQLTLGADELELDAAGPSPHKVDTSAALFTDKGSPLKLDRSSEALPPSPTRSKGVKNSKMRMKRFRKYPASTVVAHLGGQSAPASDPLFSEGSEPSSSARSVSNASDRQRQIVEDMDAPLYDVNTLDKEAKAEYSGAGLITHKGQNTKEPLENDLHKSAEAKNSSHGLQKKSASNLGPNDNHLKISVGDPLKVGDITTAHIVYVIRTINENPQAQTFTAPEASVTRRYRDFRWIYHQLQNNHPGKIIPPPPLKQTYIGRFNENFVENRRLLLGKMLAKICRIPCLANDPDFVLFLTSNDFAADSKDRESASGTAASHASLGDDDTDSPAPSIVSSSGGPQGFISSFFSIAPKIPEPNDYFSRKKSYIEDLEFNLKTFFKSLEMIAAQRIDTISVVEELATLLEELADVEILKKTTDLLSAFAEVHSKLKENLDRVNLQDQLTLGFTIEEYLRVIGSVKYTFETRTRIYQQLYSFQQDLAKKEDSLERLESRSRSSVDKINALKFEVDKLKQKVSYFENSFKTISETIKLELDNFEIEKIEDFRNSVEIFIESSIESQKEAIELWETFYEHHNLAAV